MRKIVLSVLMVLLASFQLAAQNQRVSGTVIDPEGSPISGVSVTLIGTNVTAITGSDGAYSISVPTDATLEFAYLGMATQSIPIGGRTIVNVTLHPSTVTLEGVVITASGMKRAERTIGFASTTIGSEEITLGKSPDIMAGLSGKIPGVSISSAGATGSSTKVIVRGFSSLTGSNQPLYVIDGMPFYNSVVGSAGMNNSIDFGNQANDVNPENIESITILKGASATALYGSRAANGVVMITTKSGSSGSKFSVTYDLSILGSDVLRVPQRQSTFGQGWYFDFFGYAGLGGASYLGTWADPEQGSWGPKLDGRSQQWNMGPSIMYDPSDPRYREPREGDFTYKKNSVRDFYETGLEVANTVTITGGTDKTGYMASYGNFTANGVLPSNMDKYTRNTFTFRGNSKLFGDRATLQYSINYSRKDKTDAMAGQGGSGSTIYQDIQQNPTNLVLADFKDYNDVYNNADNFYTPYAMNPYWTLAHNKATYQDDRVWGNIDLNVELIPGLNAIGRVSGDFTNAITQYMNDVWQPSADSWSVLFGGSGEAGYYYKEFNRWNQIDAQAMLSADYKVGDFSLSGLAGWNLNQRYSNYLYGDFQGLQEAGWFNFANAAAETSPVSATARRRLIGLLAQGDIGYKNFAFLTLSARNDWSSTLPTQNNSFFYWGANLALIVTDMVPSLKTSEWLDFLKLRAAYGQTGNDASTYLTSPYYVPSSMGVYFATLSFPLGGNPGLNVTTRIPATDLQPEITTEMEFGFDLRLFKNRVKVDFSYYDRVTRNQIMNLTVAPETGRASRTANVGKVGNKGVELLVGLTPVRTKDFSWDFSYTFTKNNSKVIELWEGAENYNIYAITGGIGYSAIVGQPLGVFTYDKYVQVEDEDSEYYGKYVVNSQGYLATDTSEKQILGKSDYDFIMGFANSFTYKNWSLGFTFDWRHGGLMYSATKGIMYFVGTAPETAYNNRNSFILPNTVRIAGTDANGNNIYAENNIPVNMYAGGFNGYYYDSTNPSRSPDNYMVDRSYIKLRELSLTYSFPKEWFRNTPISGLQVSLVGRNLFLWTPEGQVFIDPDMTNYGNDLTSQFGEFYAAPSTRVFGGSVKIIF